MVHVNHITHYSEDDPEGHGDYYGVTLLIRFEEEDRKEEATFGDYYHDKGMEKAEGFIYGLKAALPDQEVEVTYNEVADGGPY